MSSEQLIQDAKASEKNLLEKEKARLTTQFEMEKRISAFLFNAYSPVKKPDQNLSTKN